MKKSVLIDNATNKAKIDAMIRRWEQTNPTSEEAIAEAVALIDSFDYGHHPKQEQNKKKTIENIKSKRSWQSIATYLYDSALYRTGNEVI